MFCAKFLPLSFLVLPDLEFDLWPIANFVYGQDGKETDDPNSPDLEGWCLNGGGIASFTQYRDQECCAYKK